MVAEDWLVTSQGSSNTVVSGCVDPSACVPSHAQCEGEAALHDDYRTDERMAQIVDPARREVDGAK